jgi:hypothetical protein
MLRHVRGAFDESALFRAIAGAGARVLVIGRRAMIALGLPVMTADYDLWIDSADIEKLNVALDDLDFAPNREPAAARTAGRYVLENDEHIDVLTARQVSTKDGVVVSFEEVWQRRQAVVYEAGVELAIPSVEDLILTKRWAMRDKDVADIRLLEALRRSKEST